MDLIPERVVYDQLGNMSQVLVQWQGIPVCEKSGDHAKVLSFLFLFFTLEDKGVANGEGIDTIPDTGDPSVIVYKRRNGPRGKEAGPKNGNN